MDQYSKTTELDVSEVLYNEDDEPKKSKIQIVITVVICLIVAIGLWFYVMINDDRIYEKEFKGISLSEIETDNYVITSSEKVNVTLKGTRWDLIKLKKSDIVITVDTYDITGVGEKEAEVKCLIADGKNVSEKEGTRVGKITVQIREK